MKKFLSVLATAALATSAFAQEHNTTNYIDQWGRLKIAGVQLSSEKGEAVLLKGFSTFSLHFNAVKSCIDNSNDFQLMKDYGANAVRLAMYVDDKNDAKGYIDNPTKYLNDNLEGDIAEYLEWANDLGMYCMVDWHILATKDNSRGNAGDPNTYTTEAKEFFGRLSRLVSQKGYKHVIYELCNEPSSGIDFRSKIKPYCQEVMDVILANDPDALCVLGTESWCQMVDDAVNVGVDRKYADHSIYSFHYYACSHSDKLGKLSNAASNACVMVSEWSGVAASGDGNFCESSSKQLLQKCEGDNPSNQKISWFFWNWGTKNEGSSMFSGACTSDNFTPIGEFIYKYATGKTTLPPVVKTEEWADINPIPSTSKQLFKWENFDNGGNGVAYNDANSSAYTKDATETYYIAYSATGAESDAFSEARNFAKDDKGNLLGMNPYYTLNADETDVISYKDEVKTCIAGMDWSAGSCSGEGFAFGHKTLNAGIEYTHDWSAFARPYEGIDLSNCSAFTGNGVNAETTMPNKHSIDSYLEKNLSQVEPDEWIRYTVDVKKPGYYRVDGLTATSTKGYTGSIGISLLGKGNIIRDLDDHMNTTKFITLTFPGGAEPVVQPWGAKEDGWIWDEATDEDGVAQLGVVFTKAGKQQIVFSFGDLGNMGPLFFEFVEDLSDEELELEKSLEISGVASSDAADFAIYPNPTTGEFTVALSAGASEVSVVDMTGRVVYAQAVNGEDKVTISKKLATGVYTVVVKSAEGVKAQKLQVK